MKWWQTVLTKLDIAVSLAGGNFLPLLIHGIGHLSKEPEVKTLYARVLAETWQ